MGSDDAEIFIFMLRKIGCRDKSMDRAFALAQRIGGLPAIDLNQPLKADFLLNNYSQIASL